MTQQPSCNNRYQRWLSNHSEASNSIHPKFGLPLPARTPSKKNDRQPNDDVADAPSNDSD